MLRKWMDRLLIASESLRGYAPQRSAGSLVAVWHALSRRLSTACRPYSLPAERQCLSGFFALGLLYLADAHDQAARRPLSRPRFAASGRFAELAWLA